MNVTRREGLTLAGAAVLAGVPLTVSAASHGTLHEVEMMNKDPETGERQVFYPAVLAIAAGDSVKFVPTDKGHNSEANKDMIPEGAEAWKGKIGKEVEVTLDTPGVYGFHCTPHRSAGMVGLVLVGDVTQEMLDVAGEVRQRGKAKDRYDLYLAQAAEMIASS